MLQNKLLAVMSAINDEVAERKTLVSCIAIALLTCKNLFILGDTGAAKSYAINQFRSRITGAKQFERLLSKQADEEMLFGRLDLASLIPGSAAKVDLEANATYRLLHSKLEQLCAAYANDPSDDALRQALETLTERVASYRKTLSELHGSRPRIITDGKIPDSHIIFLDEVFKANDGILNSLLTALNERKYTNEGCTVDIPAISFFAASNEIPNFSDPAEAILRPLYDRLEIKVLVKYVEDRDNRLATLTKKQTGGASGSAAQITLDELYAMQEEVRAVTIPTAVNELMDDVLCELRRQGIHVSDRKYFNYYPLVQAHAWLCSRGEAKSTDLMILKHYLWTTPEEIPTIEQTLARLCENPLAVPIGDIRALALEAFDSFGSDSSNNAGRALAKFRAEFVSLYHKICALQDRAQTDSEKAQVAELLAAVEDLSRKAHGAAGFTYATLDELAKLQ